MDNSLTCEFPGCGYSTKSSIPADARHCSHSHFLVIHMEDFSHWSVSKEDAASTAGTLSKSTKKKRRKRARQSEVVDGAQDTAPKEVNAPDTYGSELAIQPHEAASVSNENAALTAVKLSKSATVVPSSSTAKMAGGKACSAPGCGYVTPIRIPDDVDNATMLQWLPLQLQQLQRHITAAHPVVAAPQAAPVHQPTQKVKLESPKLSAGSDQETWELFLRSWGVYKTGMSIGDAPI